MNRALEEGIDQAELRAQKAEAEVMRLLGQQSQQGGARCVSAVPRGSNDSAETSGQLGDGSEESANKMMTGG